MRNVLAVFKNAAKEFSEDNAPRLGAALAYYTMFSIAPLLLVVIAIAGLVFGREAAQGQIFAQLYGLIGAKGAGALQGMVASAAKPKTGMLATIVGVITLLAGASGVFGQLKDALNTIWEVEPKKTSGVWGFVKGRFLSVAMVLGVGFLLTAQATSGLQPEHLLANRRFLHDCISSRCVIDGTERIARNARSRPRRCARLASRSARRRRSSRVLCGRVWYRSVRTRPLINIGRGSATASKSPRRNVKNHVRKGGPRDNFSDRHRSDIPRPAKARGAIRSSVRPAADVEAGRSECGGARARKCRRVPRYLNFRRLRRRCK